MSMIQRTAQDKMGFIRSGKNLRFEGKLDLEFETGSPKGMKIVDAFGIKVTTNNDYDCMDPQSHYKTKDLGAL
jgi:hypothetical protein